MAKCVHDLLLNRLGHLPAEDYTQLSSRNIVILIGWRSCANTLHKQPVAIDCFIINIFVTAETETETEVCSYSLIDEETNLSESLIIIPNPSFSDPQNGPLQYYTTSTSQLHPPTTANANSINIPFNHVHIINITLFATIQPTQLNYNTTGLSPTRCTFPWDVCILARLHDAILFHSTILHTLNRSARSHNWLISNKMYISSH